MQKVNLDIVPRGAGGVPVRADVTAEEKQAGRLGKPLTLRHFISEALCVDLPGKEQAKISEKRKRYRLAEAVEDHPTSEFEFDAAQIVEINDQLAAGFWTRISGQCAELIEGEIKPRFFLSDFDPQTWELLAESDRPRVHRPGPVAIPAEKEIIPVAEQLLERATAVGGAHE